MLELRKPRFKFGAVEATGIHRAGLYKADGSLGHGEETEVCLVYAGVLGQARVHMYGSKLYEISQKWWLQG